MSNSEKTGGLIPPLENVEAVKAGARAIGITAEEFANKFYPLANNFMDLVVDDECYPIKDCHQVIRQLSTALKEHDIKQRSPEDAFFIGATLGWIFAGYLGMSYKHKPQEV